MGKQVKLGKSMAFSVSTKTDGIIIGRNGSYDITAVEAWCGPTSVNIQGIGKRRHSIRGGLWISHDAMDELCEKWLRRRGSASIHSTKGLPWDAKQLARHKDENGFIKAILALDMRKLGVDVDCLNDAVSEAITGNTSALEDISYRPVGVEGENVLVEVCGNVDDWLQRHDEDVTA